MGIEPTIGVLQPRSAQCPLRLPLRPPPPRARPRRWPAGGLRHRRPSQEQAEAATRRAADDDAARVLLPGGRAARATSDAWMRITSAPRSSANRRFSSSGRRSSGPAFAQAGVSTNTAMRSVCRRFASRQARRITRCASGARRRPRQDAVAGRPRRLDVVLAHVLFEVLLDGRRHFAQRQLAQRVQVALAEEAVQRLLGPLRRVDVAVADPRAQRLRRHVDDFHLVRVVDDGVRDALADGDAGDRLRRRRPGSRGAGC